MANGNGTDNAIVTPTKDGGAMVDLSAQPSKREMASITETMNMVPHIKSESGLEFPSHHGDNMMKDGPQILGEIGDIVVQDYDDDMGSRSQWEVNTARWYKLFSSYLEPKNWPWKNASNVNVPFITMASIQFQARAYEALMQKELVKGLPLKKPKEVREKAERVAKYFNYQLLYKDETFEEGMDKTLMQLPVIGCVFRKTYFDVNSRRVKSEYVSAKDVVVNYHVNNVETPKRITHVLYMEQGVLRKRVAKGIFDIAAGDLGPGSETNPSFIQQASDDVQGTSDTRDFADMPRFILEQHRFLDLENSGIPQPYVITVDKETRKVLRIVKRWFVDDDGERQTIDYFTKYGFIPNPEGYYDHGFGTLIGGLNKAGNAIINEVTDAGALANLQGGFVSKRSGLKKGSLTFNMGEFKEVDSFVDDIRKAIFTFDFKGPNSTLFSVLGLLFEYAKVVSSVSETMTGQLPSSDTPATTVLALIEEGRKVFGTIYKRIHRSFKKELKKMFRLYEVFLDEQEYFNVLFEGDVTDEILEVSASDFTDEFDIIPVSDSSITSRIEKVLIAEQIKAETFSNPVIGNENAQRVATKEWLDALNVPYGDELMGPPPGPVDRSIVEENARFIEETPSDVLPQQDHLGHIREHEALVEGPFGGQMSADAKKMVEAHNKTHLAELYKLQNAPQGAEVGGGEGNV